MTAQRINEKRDRPPDRQVRVAGTLGSVHAGDRTFVLVLESGERLPGVAIDMPGDDLAALLGTIVIVSGRAIFSSAGEAVLIEAVRVAAATENTSPWRKMPRPLAGGPKRDYREPQTATTGINAIFGKWPGDETDEEIEDLLRRRK
ncbi:hypothetical protein K8I61_08660 [bacterium]|nr:hypothetical protein [bacterium]